MRQLDALYLAHPFYGSRRMAVTLGINRKHAQRLMRLMGIEAHYPKPRLSQPAPGHTVYIIGDRVRSCTTSWSEFLFEGDQPPPRTNDFAFRRQVEADSGTKAP
jgi:hypothetical protein